MVDIVGLAQFDIPSFGIGSGKITIVLAIFFFVVAGSIIVWFVYNLRIFNKKIIVFENISGQGYQPILKDRARLISLGDAGEEVLFLKKKKKYRTAYGRKMGKNTYWFAIGQDGYWYNMVLGDIDAKMGMLDIEPIDRDMRYMHVAIRKNITDRYRKVKFLEKYGTILMGGFFMLVMVVGIWFLLDRMGEIAITLNGAIESSNKVMDAGARLLSGLDNIQGGGSINPVPA